MQTISTKHYGATNTKEPRVKATTSSGIALWIKWNDVTTAIGNHMQAAEQLKRKMKWEGIMVGGNTQDGMVFVFVGDSYQIT